MNLNEKEFVKPTPDDWHTADGETMETCPSENGELEAIRLSGQGRQPLLRHKADDGGSWSATWTFETTDSMYVKVVFG